MPNLQLLEPIERLLDERPELFDYRDYINIGLKYLCHLREENILKPENTCNTVCCIAGWIVHNKLQQIPPDKSNEYYDQIQDVGSEARDLLDINFPTGRMLFHCDRLYPLHGTTLKTDYPIEQAKLRIAVLKLIPTEWFSKSTMDPPWETLRDLGYIDDFDELKTEWIKCSPDIQQFCIAVQELEQKFFEDNDIDVVDDEINLFRCPVPHFKSLLGENNA